MKIGVVLGFNAETEENFKWCVGNGIPTCQLMVAPSLYDGSTAEKIMAMRQRTGMEITAIVGAYSGPDTEWNFTYGPLTLGIVPQAYRATRMAELERCAGFTKTLGIPAVCAHFGFIPENPLETVYGEVVAAARHLARHYGELGLRLNMETGQETPVTLMRLINDVGMGNLGVNFDPANLLMYGKANPIDALDIIGGHVNGVHAKDGEYPVDGKNLGDEKPLGQGRVNIPAFVKKLSDIGYDGALTIEREISGPEQKKDILAARAMLNEICNSL